MTYSTYDHPDFKHIAISFIMKRRGYLSIIQRNGMTIDEFIEDVRSNVWKSGVKDLAHTTIICNQVKWYIGRINRKINNTKQLFNEQKPTTDLYNIDSIDEVNKILNMECLSEKEKRILKMKYQGYTDPEIGKIISRSKEAVRYVFNVASKKIRNEYDKILG